MSYEACQWTMTPCTSRWVTQWTRAKWHWADKTQFARRSSILKKRQIIMLETCWWFRNYEVLKLMPETAWHNNAQLTVNGLWPEPHNTRTQDRNYGHSNCSKVLTSTGRQSIDRRQRFRTQRCRLPMPTAFENCNADKLVSNIASETWSEHWNPCYMSLLLHCEA